MDMSAPALQIEHLDKRFGAIPVLRDITLDMAGGEFLVLVGPSGCGKSTLLNCIAGLEQTSAGNIAIAGRDVTGVPPRDRDIAMVFQSYALYPTMTVAQNIGFGMKVRGLERDAIASKVLEVARLLQIEPLLERRPAQLSGGQRQRVAMGRALVREPALFLFDEPLSNLDAKLRVEMRAEIKKLHETTHASIVYVTHDQVEAMTLATRIVVLKQGEVQQIGTPAEIYERPANMFVADFMGSPPMNLVPARLVRETARLQFGDGQDLALGVIPPELEDWDKEFVAGIRPEHFALAEDGRGVLEVTPSLVENAGADAYITFALGEGQAVARLGGRFGGRRGEAVRLDVETSHLSFFDARSGKRIQATP